MLALKNNLLYDLALAPNIEVELPLGKRWSLNVEYKCPWWSDSGCNFCYQLLSGGTEARYWLGTAIRAEDCPDTSWEHMPKEVPMISVERGEGIPGEVLRSCRNNLWIRASTGSASGD